MVRKGFMIYHFKTKDKVIKMISIYNPDISSYTKSAIDAITSGWISNYGKNVSRATELMKNIFKVKHVILMANGTCATHCTVLGLKYKYPDISTIYVSNNSYIAACNSVLMEFDMKQIKVMKMDVDTFNICVDYDYIMGLEKNAAMMIVHNAGNVINVLRLKRIRPDIIFIEDNCEGFTGKYESFYTGTSEKSTLSSSISLFLLLFKLFV